MKRSIKLVSAFLILSLIFAQSAVAGAAGSKTGSGYICALPAPMSQMQRNQVISDAKLPYRVEPRGLLASISVNVSSPCDEEFRDLFSSWMYQANARIEQGDNDLYDWFGIDYYSVGQETWNSPDYLDDGYGLYDDAVYNIGTTNGADLMIAFSGQDSPFGGLGNSDGYCVCWEFGLEYTSNTVTHESGHMYGVYVDGGCLSDCLMSGDAHEICDSCFSAWDGNKYNY